MRQSCPWQMYIVQHFRPATPTTALYAVECFETPSKIGGKRFDAYSYLRIDGPSLQFVVYLSIVLGLGTSGTTHRAGLLGYQAPT